MIIYRLCNRKFQIELAGKGTAETGGRWNSKGSHIIYTSNSRALCLAEIAVHIPLGLIPNDYVLPGFQIPVRVKIFELREKALPKDWNEFPIHSVTQKQEMSF